jgi:putative isomerase
MFAESSIFWVPGGGTRKKISHMLVRLLRNVLWIGCLAVFLPTRPYAQLRARGWNTWDASSLLDYVHLPEGFSLNLMLKEYAGGHVMKDPLLYQKEQTIKLGPHSSRGEYTSEDITWQQMHFRFQSAVDSDRLVVLVTPLDSNLPYPASLIASAGILWQKKGTVAQTDQHISWYTGNRSVELFATDTPGSDRYVHLGNPYAVFTLDKEIGLSTGKPYSLSAIKVILDRECRKLEAQKSAYGKLSTLFDLLQSAIAWNTLYDPGKDRIATPVSRSWADWNGGYVLFEWDNYFVSYMASLYDKDLAYRNAIAITSEAGGIGFVPNMINPTMTTRDRSEPPVGAFCVREIYRRYGEKAFLKQVYDNLLAWNNWWAEHRDTEGLLVWGSNAYKARTGNYWETPESGVNGRQGASYESGMDNAPMYFDIPFDTLTGKLLLWDVGLNSLYIQDCTALADIAAALGKTGDAHRLLERARAYTHNLGRLWDERTGIYRNRRVDNGAFSPRLSPTCFYPLLTDAPDSNQVGRMMREHFYNTEEFYGEWMLPSVPRNDTSFGKQNYWQGRIWGPLNFLVYIGLRKQHLKTAQADLAARSKALLLKNWTEHHYVCENYNAITGEGSETGASSDPFYHWGALLGMMEFIEQGQVPAPEEPLFR